MCFAATSTGAAPLRSVTFQPLSLTIQSTNAPTASGSDCSIARAGHVARTRTAPGTGSATTAGWPVIAGR